MPIPKPTRIGDTVENLHYMSFEEAQVLPFTSKHQLSLKATSLRIATVTKRREAVARSKLGVERSATTLSNKITKLKNKAVFKIAAAQRVRGVVDYKSC